MVNTHHMELMASSDVNDLHIAICIADKKSLVSSLCTELYLKTAKITEKSGTFNFI